MPFPRLTARSRTLVTIALTVLACILFSQWPRLEALYGIVASRLRTPLTVEDRLDMHSQAVATRLGDALAQAGIPYPPARLCLIGLKQEKQLELWAAGQTGPMRKIKTYPILAASGTSGPKLHEGDRQVPEGIYAVESLNPNSRYHVALRINYPNCADREHAHAEGRTRPGSDIMIHGKAVSVGCLAMGDPAAEELFVLAALTGVENIRVLLSPCDLRVKEITPLADAPAWTVDLYRELAIALRDYQMP